MDILWIIICISWAKNAFTYKILKYCTNNIYNITFITLPEKRSKSYPVSRKVQSSLQALYNVQCTLQYFQHVHCKVGNYNYLYQALFRKKLSGFVHWTTYNMYSKLLLLDTFRGFCRPCTLMYFQVFTIFAMHSSGFL